MTTPGRQAAIEAAARELSHDRVTKPHVLDPDREARLVIDAYERVLAEQPGERRATDNDVNELIEMPRDLLTLLQDPSIIIRQDAAVFELLAKWQKAPSPTMAGPALAEQPRGEETSAERCAAGDCLPECESCEPAEPPQEDWSKFDPMRLAPAEQPREPNTGRQAAIEAAAKAIHEAQRLSYGTRWEQLGERRDKAAFRHAAEKAVDAYERVLAEQPREERATSDYDRMVERAAVIEADRRRFADDVERRAREIKAAEEKPNA